MNTSRRRLSRATLVLVAVLFLTPFVVALLANRLGWQLVGTRNHGELVQPPRPLGEMDLRDRAGGNLALLNLDHRFTLFVQVPAACASECSQRLDELHRVRYSLGRHAPRLAIRLLTPGQLPPLPPSLQTLDPASAAALVAAADGLLPMPDWTGLLVDDKGYAMLRFPPDLEPRLIRRDLGRLIR